MDLYESEFLVQCLECDETYVGDECPACGSTSSRPFDDEDDLEELDF